MAEDTRIRENIGIAIDGGGVKGTVVAHGIIELEKTLGSPIIDNPRVKVLAGTSTGALITTALAVGMTGAQILRMYETLGDVIFSKAGKIRPFGNQLPLIGAPTMPIQMLRFIRRLPAIGDLLAYILLPSRYSFDPLRETMLQKFKEVKFPVADPTMAEMAAYLNQKPHQPTLIITAVEIHARRTRFLKTSDPRFLHMKLVDAMLASSSIPTYWEPVPITDPERGKPTDRLLVDGGVGSFGNPALVAAWELCDIRNLNQDKPYPASEVTIFSFGTGFLPVPTYAKTYPHPERWWALNWASRSQDLFINDAIREQSRNIVSQYRGVDLRRFQVVESQAMSADRFDLIPTVLKEEGQAMARLIAENRHAFRLDPQFRHDPEEIWNEDIERLLKRDHGI